MALISEGHNQPFFFTDPCKHAREVGGWIGISDAVAPPSPTTPPTNEWGSELDPHYGYSQSPEPIYDPIKLGDGVAKWEKFRDEEVTQLKSLASGPSKTPKWGYDRDISSIFFDDLFKSGDEGSASKWTYDPPSKSKPEYAEMVRKSGSSAKFTEMTRKSGRSPKFKAKQESPKQLSTSPKISGVKPKKGSKEKGTKAGDSRKISKNQGQKSRSLKPGSRKSKKRRNNKSKAPPGFQGSHLQRAVSRMGKYWDLVPTWYKRKLASGDYFVV